MFSFLRGDPLTAAKLAALDKAFAIIEFAPGSEILGANALFRDLMGYSEADLQGANHALFVEPEEAQSAAYREFWAKLRRGESVTGAFRRVRKDGRKVLVSGAYSPVFDAKGQVVRVLKAARDVTPDRTAFLETSAKLDALAKMQGVVEFAPDGTALAVNDVMLGILGYERSELIGKPHSLVVPPEEAASPEYRAFWDRLRAGDAVEGNFRRLGKHGKPVLMKGSYNPIRDIEGKVVKIVKFRLRSFRSSRAGGTGSPQSPKVMSAIVSRSRSARISISLGPISTPPSRR